MMTSTVAGIDPHQNTITVSIVDPNGVAIVHDTFPNSAAGHCARIELLTAHGFERVGVRGSASWGAHVAIALVAARFDAHEVPRGRFRRWRSTTRESSRSKQRLVHTGCRG